MITINLDTRELATILAALRLWQWHLEEGGPVVTGNQQRIDMISDLACGNGSVRALNEEEIDALCERIKRRKIR